MKTNLYTLICALLLVISGSLQLHAQSYYITTIAGTGVLGHTGDGGPATNAQLNTPHSVFTDPFGNILLTENTAGLYYVRKISPAGVITTLAGTGSAGYTGDGGPATAASISLSFTAISDSVGNVFFSDQDNNVVRKITTSGIITTVAGTNVAGSSGDGGPASAAMLNVPDGLAFDGEGNLYIGDAGNAKIRKISISGVISTYAGTGTAGYSGDGVPATSTRLNHPNFLYFNRASNCLYIADNANHRIRKVNASGIITTVAGNGISGFSGDGLPATAAQISYPGGINMDVAGNLYIASDLNEKIRVVNTAGIMGSFAGNGLAGYNGDGLVATAAELNTPVDITFDTSGNLVLADMLNSRIRRFMVNHRPSFTGGNLQTFFTCNNTPYPLNSLLTINDSDAGQTERWQLISVPDHGSLTTAGVAGLSYTAMSTGSALSISAGTTGINYVPTHGFVGLDTFFVRINDSISSDTAEFIVTVNGGPNPGHLPSTDSVCAAGGHLALVTGGVPGGRWYSSSIANVVVDDTGLITGITPGTSEVSYVIGGDCGNDTASTTVKVQTPVLPILGDNTVCQFQTLLLIDAISGGTWSSSSSLIAPVAGGLVVGLTPGSATITYSLQNACGTTTSSVNVTVITGGVCDTNTALHTTAAVKEELSIYPNPNNGSFNLDLSSGTNEQAIVAIINMTGKKVQEITTATNQLTTIQLDKATGIYFVKVLTASGKSYIAEVITTQ